MKVRHIDKYKPILKICGIFAAFIMVVYQCVFLITDPTMKRIASVLATGIFIYGVLLLILQLIKKRN